ncbi:hypothetical protein ACFFSW_03020 [Saccharothrix longispora]|uniref:Uncharacterized protein n=1 Tax=Saccharothrix longispora TaxID=33920 RepID=A0ABU1PWD7_9PSEU|nr:hypothetical protein [Saccharothrix longispora]MDR6594962.1 hypothetical protein [Saccharothrix longispora]
MTTPGRDGGRQVDDEHRRQEEYWLRAADAAGFRARTGFGIAPGAVPDVAVHGAADTAIGIRGGRLPAGQVARGTVRAHRAGWLPLWFAGSGRYPSWFNRVPSVGCNRTSWDDVPRRGALTAVGLRRVTARRCDVHTFDRCPAGRRTLCGRYHPYLEQWTGMRVDDVAEQVPAREAVPLAPAPDRVYLVPVRDLARYREMTGGLGAYEPAGPAGASGVAERAHRWCAACGNPLLYLRPGRDRCERCRSGTREPVTPPG